MEKEKWREGLVETSPCPVCLNILFSPCDLPPFSLLKSKKKSQNAIIHHLQENNP